MPYEPMVTTCALPFWSSTVRPSACGVLATEREDVADLDAARELERAGAVGRRVAGAHLGGLDRAVGGEVAAGDEVEHVACPARSAPVIQRVPGTTRGSSR